MKAVLWSFIHVFAHIDQPSRLANTTKQIFRHNGPTELNMLKNIHQQRGPRPSDAAVCKASPSTGSRALPTSKTSKVDILLIPIDIMYMYINNIKSNYI